MSVSYLPRDPYDRLAKPTSYVTSMASSSHRVAARVHGAVRGRSGRDHGPLLHDRREIVERVPLCWQRCRRNSAVVSSPTETTMFTSIP